MSKKHFEVIAEAIRISLFNARISGGASVVRATADNIALELARTNARFDKARFLAACGFDNV